MSLSSDIIDELFEDPNIGQDATYTAPSGGTPQAIKVVPNREDAITSFGQSRVQSEKGIFEVRKSELPSPAIGGIIIFGDVNYTIKGPPRSDDPDRLVWTVECYKA